MLKLKYLIYIFHARIEKFRNRYFFWKKKFYTNVITLLCGHRYLSVSERINVFNDLWRYHEKNNKAILWQQLERRKQFFSYFDFLNIWFGPSYYIVKEISITLSFTQTNSYKPAISSQYHANWIEFAQTFSCPISLQHIDFII